jgi:hypothetical protein
VSAATDVQAGVDAVFDRCCVYFGKLPIDYPAHICGLAMAKIEWSKILTLIGTLCLAGFGVVGFTVISRGTMIQQIFLITIAVALLIGLYLGLTHLLLDDDLNRET